MIDLIDHSNTDIVLAVSCLLFFLMTSWTYELCTVWLCLSNLMWCTWLAHECYGSWKFITHFFQFPFQLFSTNPMSCTSTSLEFQCLKYQLERTSSEFGYTIALSSKISKISYRAQIDLVYYIRVAICLMQCWWWHDFIVHVEKGPWKLNDNIIYCNAMRINMLRICFLNRGILITLIIFLAFSYFLLLFSDIRTFQLVQFRVLLNFTTYPVILHFII